MPEGLLDDYFRRYGLIAIFAALAVGVPTGMLMASWLLSLVNIRPSLPTAVKKSIYECGFETLGGRWTRFNFRYYGIALLFVIFDVEVVFLFRGPPTSARCPPSSGYSCSWRWRRS